MAKRKFNNKHLLIIFAVLLAIVLLTRYTEWGQQERTFRKNLVDIDTASVEKITIFTGSEGGNNLSLKREGGSWKVQKGEQTFPASSDKIKNALSRLEDAEVQRLVARKKEQWPEYEVTDSLGKRIQITQNSQTALDLVLGKFSFDRASRSTTSFVRLASGNTVYAVDGMLNQSITSNLNEWRDRTIIEGNDAYWDELTFEYPADSGFVLSKNDKQWTIDGTPVDSASTAQYLNKLTTIRNPDFAEDFSSDENPMYTLTISGNQGGNSITIEGYQAANGGEYVIHSSQNPTAYFQAPEDGLFSRIFTGKQQLLKSQD